jgi:HNH endonuclease
MLKMPPYNIHSTTVGHCVYCGSKTDLTKEHIIPFGLGGDQTLLDGSCGECAEKTKRFEQDCLRGWFGAFRIKAGFAGRRRKKVDRPDHIPLTRSKECGFTRTITRPP